MGDERDRLIGRRQEQYLQSRLCVNTTIWQTKRLNVTFENGVNTTYNVHSSQKNRTWAEVYIRYNSTGLYCTLGQRCFNTTAMKNITLSNSTHNSTVERNVTVTKCVDIVDDGVCTGTMQNITTVENVSLTGGKWSLQNVTVSKCIKARKIDTYARTDV